MMAAAAALRLGLCGFFAGRGPPGPSGRVIGAGTTLPLSSSSSSASVMLGIRGGAGWAGAACPRPESALPAGAGSGRRRLRRESPLPHGRRRAGGLGGGGVKIIRRRRDDRVRPRLLVVQAGRYNAVRVRGGRLLRGALAAAQRRCRLHRPFVGRQIQPRFGIRLGQLLLMGGPAGVLAGVLLRFFAVPRSFLPDSPSSRRGSFSISEMRLFRSCSRRRWAFWISRVSSVADCTILRAWAMACSRASWSMASALRFVSFKIDPRRPGPAGGCAQPRPRRRQ